MKIVHIATSLEGGAGLCAARIMNATRQLGVDACALVAHGNKSNYVDVVIPNNLYSRFRLIRYVQILLNMKGLWPKTARIARKIAEERQKNHKPVVFSSPVTLYTNIVNHPWIREADIVHLHWIGNYVDHESFFSKINKPVVWTIHDQNPGFGGFHYQMWYESAIDSFKALDDKLALLKRHAYKNVGSMMLVAISSYMKEFFQKSSLLSNFPCTLIHNGLEETRFVPISKECAREALGLSMNSKVFLFVAQYIYQDVKGLNVLIDALEKLNIPDSILLCMGRYDEVPRTSFEVRCEGFVENNRLQSLYYSAADYFVIPSNQETFAQTPMEAMACGTPVVSFPFSGSHDLINKENGIVCDDFTVDALVKGVKLAMNRNYNREIIREDVINRFSYKKIARQYMELYEEIIKKHS